MARGRLQDEMLSLCKHVLLHRHARPWSRNMDFVGDGRYTMKLDHLARSNRPELLILRKRSSFATDCAKRIGSRSTCRAANQPPLWVTDNWGRSEERRVGKEYVSM